MEYSHDYEMVAEARGHEVIRMERFGSYQGEWLMVSKDTENYYLWKDYYGSCSGCDPLEAEFEWGEDYTDEKVKAFARNYEPFLTVPKDTFEQMKAEGTLVELFPRNIVDGYDVTTEDLNKFIESL